MRVPVQKLTRFSHKESFSHAKTFGGIGSFPPSLFRIPKYIKDQQATNYCTAAARSSAGSYLWNEEMSFEYQTAKEGQVAGQPIFQGADPNIADKASEEYGFLPQKDCPFSFQKDGWQIPAQWQQYAPELDKEAINYTGFAPFNVYPDYDSIKQALYQGFEDDAVVIANGFWFDNWQEHMDILPMPGKKISRHDYLFIDWKVINGTEHLVAQLSQGIPEGDNGVHYMSKEVVNAAFQYPAFNGVGCTIYRKGYPNPVQTTIDKLQMVVILCGEIISLLKGKLGYVA